jgi:hypothetical protein
MGKEKKSSSLKALDLLLWHQVNVFSVSLTLLKVGMLGYVAMDAASLYRTAQGAVGSEFLSPVLP